jgi:hypothetical protein
MNERGDLILFATIRDPNPLLPPMNWRNPNPLLPPMNWRDPNPLFTTNELEMSKSFIAHK